MTLRNFLCVGALGLLTISSFPSAAEERVFGAAPVIAPVAPVANPPGDLRNDGDASTGTALGLVWYDGNQLRVEGLGWPGDDPQHPFRRLPLRAQAKVPPAVWNLAQHPSGVTIRFLTDATTIGAHWTGGEAMNHMAATGSHGLDLYERRPDSQLNRDSPAFVSPWKYRGTGRPTKALTSAIIVREREPVLNEFLLYLPTYHSTTSVLVGVNPGAQLIPAPQRTGAAHRPIVFYGTSITQAGCASRSGMGHVSILGRWLDREVINLGFSGSGKSEPELAELLAELQPALFVLEPLPNLTIPQVSERLPAFVSRLRASHPAVPIVLVENVNHPADHPQNRALQAVVAQLKQENLDPLELLPSAGQIQGREDGTVDGVHPTDLGFERMAYAYEPILRRLLQSQDGKH